MTDWKTRGGHTSSDKPYGELPKVSNRPAVGARHRDCDYSARTDIQQSGGNTTKGGDRD